MGWRPVAQFVKMAAFPGSGGICFGATARRGVGATVCLRHGPVWQVLQRCEKSMLICETCHFVARETMGARIGRQLACRQPGFDAAYQVLVL